MEKIYDLDTFLQGLQDFYNRYNCFFYNTCTYKFLAFHRLNIYKNQQYNKLHF